MMLRFILTALIFFCQISFAYEEQLTPEEQKVKVQMKEILKEVFTIRYLTDGNPILLGAREAMLDNRKELIDRIVAIDNASPALAATGAGATIYSQIDKIQRRIKIEKGMLPSSSKPVLLRHKLAARIGIPVFILGALVAFAFYGVDTDSFKFDDELDLKNNILGVLESATLEELIILAEIEYALFEITLGFNVEATDNHFDKSFTKIVGEENAINFTEMLKTIEVLKKISSK